MNEKEFSMDQEGVAIIGMAGRFPDAEDIAAFWRNLCQGRESITFFHDDELSPTVPETLRSKKEYIKARGVLSHADAFDAAFFGVSPREAAVMDPQQRIFMEIAWAALENAGYVPDDYAGLIGVYAGTGENSYLANHVNANPHIAAIIGEHQTSLLNAPDYLAPRVSYKFDLTGPSVSLYTGCSTSLVAVCHGYDSLMTYQSDMILAGGSFIWCPQNRGYVYHPGGILSQDGHCRPFDVDSQGTVFSNGAGVVVLKRLEDALRDNDHIYAVIRGTGMNNDGSAKVSFTAPSVQGQANVVAMAHAAAGIDPADITYIEAHGTGTPIGDPIEIAALSQVFAAATDKKGYCAIGSVKSNVGHLDAAAGVAGLIKTVLSLYHKQIPPTIHFNKPNPALDLEKSAFFVNDRLMEWKTDKGPRMAGVSAFGVGGTNAHVVIEQAPRADSSEVTRPWQLLLLSAKTRQQLEKATANLIDYMQSNPQANLADIAYTLKVGRKEFEHRCSAICSQTGDAVSQLNTATVRCCSDRVRNPDTVFMFPGQGAQYVNMGIGLYQSEKKFRQIVDYAADFLRPTLGGDLRKILYPNDADADVAKTKLQQTMYTQPILFAIEYAFAHLWIEWGIRPAAMIGHSIGEYVAACLSGVFSLDDALALVAARGELVQTLAPGAMLAVFLDEHSLAPYLGTKVSISAINAPSICTVSGPVQAIQALQAKLFAASVHCRQLETSHAFHSEMMEPILERFFDKVAGVSRRAPTIPFVSNLTGTWIRPEDAQDPGYWCQHLRSPVRFSDGMQCLLEKDYRVYLEAGPGNTANILARQQPAMTSEHLVLSSARHPKQEQSDVAVMLDALGHLWLAGRTPDWSAFYREENRRRVPLPTYPFDRQRHWLPAARECIPMDESLSPAKGLFDNLSAHTTIFEDCRADDAGDSDRKLRQEIEREITEVWKNFLGIKNVAVDDSFFDLGGSSLLAVSMFIKLEEIFKKKLPVATLYKAPTIRKLATVLTNGDVGDHWRSLVPIQPEGENPPLFLVHGAGGNVLIYRELARQLAPHQPVYGLQAKGLNGEEQGFERVEEMAAYYLAEVLAVQPDGPYLLGGYCMGGTVALEMAQQLRARGKDVRNVIFLETYNFSKIPPLTFVDKAWYYSQKIDFHLRNFILLNATNKIRFFKEKAKVARARKEVWVGLLTSKFGQKISLENDRSKALYELWQTNDRAADQYVPKPYGSQITHFVPRKEYRHHSGPDLMWETIAPGKVKTIVLPVYPAGMIVDPFVDHLAEELKKNINDSLSYTKEKP